MENIIKKGITSLLIVVMMLSISMPVMVNATNENLNADVTESEVKSKDDVEPTEPEKPIEFTESNFENLEKGVQIKFKGKVYRPLDYNCKMFSLGNYSEETEATFIKVNKLLGTTRSITINVNGKSVAIKANQVTFIEQKEINNTGKYTIDDMKLNTIVYFTGKAYGSMDYSCIRGVRDTFEEETAGIVWKINKLYGNNSITVQLSNGIFRTVPIEQVVYESQREYMTIEHSSLQDLKDGKVALGLNFDGEKYNINLAGSTNGTFALEDGVLTAGISDGFCKLTITSKESDEEPIELNIIKDASGNINLDFANASVSAEAEAEIFEIIKGGGQANLSIKDGNIEVSAQSSLSTAKSETEIFNASGEASYDLNKIKDEDNDIQAGTTINILGKTLINREKTNTNIVKALRTIINRFFK